MVSGWQLSLYDLTTRKQTKIFPKFVAWPAWSRDGESLFFHVTDPEQAWYRFRLSDRTVAPVVSLKKIGGRRLVVRARPR
jgi:hypothetical protein